MFLEYDSMLLLLLLSRTWAILTPYMLEEKQMAFKARPRKPYMSSRRKVVTWEWILKDKICELHERLVWLLKDDLRQLGRNKRNITRPLFTGKLQRLWEDHKVWKGRSQSTEGGCVERELCLNASCNKNPEVEGKLLVRQLIGRLKTLQSWTK